MKIEDASPFLQVNAVAQRARRLILGHPMRVRTELRRPAAVALEELRAGKLGVLDPVEAKQILDEDTRGPTEEEQAATEEARAALARMFGEEGEGAPEDLAPEDLTADDLTPEEVPPEGLDADAPRAEALDETGDADAGGSDDPVGAEEAVTAEVEIEEPAPALSADAIAVTAASPDAGEPPAIEVHEAEPAVEPAVAVEAE